jgi:AcrR family transcriptional regulator
MSRPDLENVVTYDVDMTTTDRAPLTRERIVEAAVAYAGENGVESLSMRKLGAELGVEAMSLYNHVDNKDDIYDGMIDYVFASIPLPDPDLSWQESTRQIGAAAIAGFIEHHWVVSLLMQRGTFGPGALAFMDHVLEILTRAGFEDEDINHAWQMLASHTMGYAFQSASSPGAVEKELARLDIQISQMGDRFPNVARLGPLLAHCQYSSEYMFGLEIIIDGLESRLGQ